MFLSLDTCGLDFSIALMKEGKIIGDYCCHEPQKQSEQLVLEIEKLLTGLNLTYDDLTGIIATKGPGSFNGIRVGYSTAAAIAIAKQIPLMTINSLATLFYQGLLSGFWDFPSNIAFLLDEKTALFQSFERTADLILPPMKIEVIALPKDTQIFSLKNFSLEEVNFSKAASGALALATLPARTFDSAIIYGKEPAIS
jgi:tRNA threonylcarbamoyl adenosine modification protein YeaZ